MTSPTTDNAPDLVSKVTFSPVSDTIGNQALIVTIKSVIPQAEDISKVMEKPRRSLSFDSKKSPSDVKRKTRSRTLGNTKSTMTEQRHERSLETQTSFKVPGATSSPSVESVAVPSSSALKSVSKTQPAMDLPCLKHAAENISRKASTIESEKVSLCNDCSKSMLSYIFVVQDFLDSLAKEIVGNSDSQNCVQCLRQETRMSVSARGDDETSKVTHSENRKSSKYRNKDVRSLKIEEESRFGKQQSSTRTQEPSRDARRYEESSDQLIERSLSQHRQIHQQDLQGYSSQANIPNLQGSEGSSEQQIFKTYSQVGDEQSQVHTSSHDLQSSHTGSNQGQQETHQNRHVLYRDQPAPQNLQVQQNQQASGQPGQDEHQSCSERYDQQGGYPDESIFSGQVPLRKPVNRQQRPDFVSYKEQQNEGNVESSVSTPFSEGVDGIVSTLSNAEREVYDGARNGAGWEGLCEAQERLVSSSSSPIPSEAYVTMCRNNAEALACLVVGTSLLLSRTSRTLCVLVSDGVSNAFRAPLSSVFHEVQCVRSMDSLGSTKLALLEQPELGVSFEKLNVWRLLQFNKCVFLNPDTLVIQNCDELFCRDELSAVADIGWPDCFNSGVFVFVPSLRTFWQLLEFAEKQGSYDGGDQGLLNSYFNSWSEDIHKKLSFVYNLMANVSYTYTPAFKQFGRNVKVVQFHGSFKPWHVKFFSRTGQISPESAVHPTYVQFVHIWLNIFRISALRQLPQDIRSYAQSQEVICAVELLRFFPLPTESEAEFFLTPPSVRLRLAERRLHKSPPKATSSDVQRRKSAEFLPRTIADDSKPNTRRETVERLNASLGVEVARPSAVEAVGEATSVVQIPETISGPEEGALPGSEVGDYQGMKAWEQGRMDYQGTDSSDTIIKRLQFLMAQPK